MNVIPAVDRHLASRLPFGPHGAVALPDVVVRSYTLVLREKEKFLGDSVNKTAFAERLDRLRKNHKGEKDPLGRTPTTELDKSDLLKPLDCGDPAGRKIIQAAIDDFSDSLADIIQKYRKADDGWRRVKAIAVGGGMSEGAIGRLIVSRTRRRLRDRSIDCKIMQIDRDPDIAGILGAAYLAPSWIFSSFDGLLGVDIGGTNIRCGVLCPKMSRQHRITKLKLKLLERWRHADDDQNRSETIDELVEMLQRLVRKSKRAGLSLAPFVGVGCPGRIRPDGLIDRGAQNLPGKWDSESFNLPTLIRENVPILKQHDTIVVMHNDAVVQGLSQIPRMTKFDHWAILTIGTGLGNAQFANEAVRRTR